MNSLINAASGVTEAAKAAVWGKPEDESGTEPQNEDTSLTRSVSKPYDPGNQTDTAPTSPTAAEPAEPGASLDGKAVEVAIPAPGNEEVKPVDPSEGAVVEAKEVKEVKEVKADEETAVLVTSEEKKEESKEAATNEVAQTEAPKTPAKAVVAATSKTSEDSPASTAGSGKKGLRSKLKEKLHIGSGKSSPQS